MPDANLSSAVFKTSAERLSKIMGLQETTPETWSDKDLPALLRHQMSAPLEFDLRSLALGKSESDAREKTVSAAAASRIKTFRDLFEHPQPPLALLKWGKDFFKQQAGPSARRRPDQEVAYLVYLLCIVTARVRLGTRITELTDAELLKGLTWALRRNWLDATTREWCGWARNALEAHASD
jgi:hypothetical protein